MARKFLCEAAMLLQHYRVSHALWWSIWVGRPSGPAGIIRAFAGDGDVVDVAFAQARAGDPHELRLVVELGQVSRADISHRRTQAAG